MDTRIRRLLLKAEKCSDGDTNSALKQAYNLLQNVAETRPRVDSPDSFGQDLFVLCAELAFQKGHTEIAKECIQMFFMKQQPLTQFVCRAYICQAQLILSESSSSIEQLEKAIVHILKAVSIAKKAERYHFLVYNASVIYWQMCRPYLKPGYRHHLAYSLHQVVKALNDTGDSNDEWRARLMIALIECYLDGHQRSEASQIASMAADFTRSKLPALYKKVFGLMVEQQLVDTAQLLEESQLSPELIVLYKICKLKNEIYPPDLLEAKKMIPMNETVTESLLETESNLLQESSAIDQTLVNDQDFGADYEVESKMKDFSFDILSILALLGVSLRQSQKQSVTYPLSWKNFRKEELETDITETYELPINKSERSLLLLEVCHLCLELDLYQLASICMEVMKQYDIKDSEFHLHLVFIECQLMLSNLGDKKESWQQSVVDIRLQAIRKCEEAVRNSVRQGDQKLIQTGCVTLWNLCLPLLQPNLRHFVHKPLAMITESLENIDSLLIKLRCEAHMELACCLEDQDQIQVAINNLKKAFNLDVKNIYHERLAVVLRRLEMRSQLYVQPSRPEDQAAMIIEQAQKADSSTIRMKRSMLVKAGEMLAPDAFLVVLDSENEAKKHSESFIKNLAGKAVHFKTCVSKAKVHLQRLQDENCRERARLWGDLAKMARKQEVFDVCRVACRFCLLYDSGHWQNRSERDKNNASDVQLYEEEEEKSVLTSEALTSTTESTQLYDRDLIRMMAEISFINGEALVQFLRSENVQLNDKPMPPESQANISRGLDAKKIEEDENWITYCNWIKDLSELATYSFMHGMELGIKLAEPWLVHNAATYIWNYNNKLLSQGRQTEIVPHLSLLLEGLKRVGFAGETMLLVNICNALAQGLIKPWIPGTPDNKPVKESPSPKAGKKRAAKAPASQARSKASLSSVCYTDIPDVIKAIDICEFAMQVTNGDDPNNSVPIYHRLPLLQTWVQAKQLAQQQISKHFGSNTEDNSEGESQMTRAIVALEMFVVGKNGIMEFKDVPNIGEIVMMVEWAKWTDKFVELTLWTRLTSLAFEAHIHNLAMQCCLKALRFSALGTQPRNRKMDLQRYSKIQELLSYASILRGQVLMETMRGRDSVRRDALNAFLDSAKFARSAGKYALVMAAARHFWNAILPLVTQPNERECLREALRIMLECISATADTTKKQNTPTQATSKDRKAVDGCIEVCEVKKNNKGDKEQKPEVKTSETVRLPNETSRGAEDDIKLRAAMYGVLFQAYADKGKWTEAFEAIEKAVSELPRSNNKLLIFKHKLMVKATTGQPIHMDIQRFKTESEVILAEMWKRVGLIAKTEADQLACYQSAIEALENESSGYQKAEYLLELGQWLYSNNFSLDDAKDQIGWAIDILLNIRAVDSQAAKFLEGKKGKASGRISVVQTQKRISSVGAKKYTPRDSLKSTVSSPTLPYSKGARSKGPVSSPAERKDAPNVCLDQDVDINAGDYIPLTKVAEIGVLPVNLELTVGDLWGVRQLDALIRSHILLAEIHGRESDQYRDILLMAQQFLMRLWKVLVCTYGSRMKEIGKTGFSNVKDDVVVTTKPGLKKEEKKEDKKKEDKVKVKKKYPVDVLPSDSETWATYEWPDEGFEAFKTEELRQMAVNQDNIPKPTLTFHYLERLVTLLRDVGYHHLALPVLAFQDLLARSVVKCDALVTLVHLRSFEVCLELNIKAGISYHLKMVGSMCINVEDQAKSRIEMLQYQEMHKCDTEEPDDLKRTKDGGESRVTESRLGKVLSGVSLRDIWTDTAEVLIRQSLYQRAREFLTEANMAAEAFSDQVLQSRIMLLFARLAYYEAQYDLAENLCLKAQELRLGDEQFWFDTCILHTKTILKRRTGIESFKKAKHFLKAAIREFTQVGDSYPNRKGVVKVYCTKLEAEIVKVHFKCIFQKSKDSNSPQILQAILKGCEYYEHICEQFMKLHCYQDAVSIARKHGSILRMLANESTEKEIRCTYYSQALNILRQALHMAEQIYTDALTLSTLSELKAVSIPIQWELAEINMELGEVMSDILVSREKERQNVNLQAVKRPSIIDRVQEFIWEPPVYDDKEQQWLDLESMAADEAMALFTCAHSMSAGKPYLRAKSLAGLGRLLKVVSDCHGPDTPSRWMVHDIEMLRVQLTAEEELAKVAAEMEAAQENRDNEDEEVASNYAVPEQVAASVEDTEKDTSVEVDEATLKKWARYTQQIAAKKKQHEISKFYCLCASECLSQCLNISLQHHYTDLAAKASFEMFTLIGQHDPSSASMMLSLFQSCQSSLIMQEVLFKSQSDPLTSQLAALMHQRHHLLKNDVKTNCTSSPLFKDITSVLSNDWQAWKRLEIAPNYLDIVKELPSNYILLVLQHSPDKSFLFAAVLDKSKSGLGAKMKSRKSADTPVKNTNEILKTFGEDLTEDSARARVFGTPTDISQLQQVLVRLSAFKRRQQSMLLKKEYQRIKAAQGEKLLENMNNDFKATFIYENDDDTNEDAILENEFFEIVEAMNNYLKPVLEPVCNSLRSDKSRVMMKPTWQPYYGLFFGGRLQNSIRNDSEALNIDRDLAKEGKDKEKSSKETLSRNECLVLLADADLIGLPLEANVHLQQLEGVASVSRDFSLQFLCHRAQQGKQDSELGGKSADAKKKPTSKETGKMAPRTLGLRDAKQRTPKIVPLDRTPQGWQAAVNTHFFRYIVDPFLDSAEGEPKDPHKEFGQILEHYEQQFTTRWLGVLGSDHTPSVGEWEIYMTESSAFIFYGMERLLGYIPPYKISALNLTECNILLSFDQMETQKSFHRQCKLDTLKSPLELSLESPLETAMLTSLSGIRSILQNQWNCSLEENAHKINLTMTSLLQKGKTTGQTAYLLQNPQMVLMEEKLAQSMAAKTKEIAALKDGKKNKEEGNVPKDKPKTKDKDNDTIRDEEQNKPRDDELVKETASQVGTVSRSVFNMVCFGMPNLIVTQETSQSDKSVKK
ncbi:hypothetical protein BsWGS_01212 [Bradybaena similaris]